MMKQLFWTVCLLWVQATFGVEPIDRVVALCEDLEKCIKVANAGKRVLSFVSTGKYDFQERVENMHEINNVKTDEDFLRAMNIFNIKRKNDLILIFLKDIKFKSSSSEDVFSVLDEVSWQNGRVKFDPLFKGALNENSQAFSNFDEQGKKLIRNFRQELKRMSTRLGSVGTKDAPIILGEENLALQLRDLEEDK